MPTRQTRLAAARPLLLAAAALLLTGCGDAQPAERAASEPVPVPADAPAAASTVDAARPQPFGVSGAALRINPNPDAPAAAYFTVDAGPTPATLVGVVSPDAGRVEMHETRMASGTMTMAAVSQVPIGADTAVPFRPGGLHLMLFKLAPAARAAGSVRLRLRFADGRTLETDATVAALAAMDDPGTRSTAH